MDNIQNGQTNSKKVKTGIDKLSPAQKKVLADCNKKGKRHRFTSENQPSPQAKKEGWDRKKAREEMYEKMAKCGGTFMSVMKAMIADAKKNPHKYTVNDVIMMDHVTNKKYRIDYLNRMMGKPTQNIEADIKATNITLEELRASFEEEDDE